MNSTLGIIAALLTVGSWTMGTLSFSAASQKMEPLSVNRVRLLYAFIVLLIMNAIFFGISPIELFTHTNIDQWIWLGISGIIGLTIGDYFAFSAYRYIGGSRASLFATVAPLAALLLGMLMLGETINGVGMIGMAISLGGILWFVQSQNKAHHISNQGISRKDLINGMLYALLGSICQGLGLVFAKKGLIIQGAYDLNPMHATWIRMGVAASLTYIIGAFRSNLFTEFKHITFNISNFKPVIAGTLFGPVIGVSLSMLAAKNLEVSLAQTIFSLLPISVMFTAHFTGKEKVTLSAYLAALISIVGVVILVWRNEMI